MSDQIKRAAPALGPRDFYRRDGGPVWLPTGSVRLRAGWFGRAIIEIEEYTEISDRPAGAGYSPGWWRRVQRWAPAKRGETLPLPAAAQPDAQS